MDGDVFGLAHKEKNLPPTKQTVIDLLNAQKIKPTLFIDSGYGVYGYYVFKDEDLRIYSSTL